MVQLKICGITRAEDLEACVELGVDAIGINLWPGSPRHVDAQRARQLLVHARRIVRVGVFVDASLAEVEAAVVELALDLIQLHGDLDPAPFAALAGRLGIGWIQVVRGVVDLDALRIPDPPPRWILLDAAVPGFGGAGRTTDWAWAARAVQRLAPIPVWLAGGIDPANAARAIAEVRPAGLDLASGAEHAPGIKSREAIASLRAICNNVEP